MNPRERQEKWENERLSSGASLASQSRGRIREEPQDPIRTVYQRDRDRVLHSRAFRRLKHKTQVFVDPDEDHFRTRLTHTLEVSQVARTISRALGLNEDLTEAISLGHDLGHTPFGHVGEVALDKAWREFVPEARFRHYEQSLRVVEKLEVHGEGPGLNLTWETRDGIAHHSKGTGDLDTTIHDLPGTLEGQVVRIADRVAYVNHDLDDAICAGLIHLRDVPLECLQGLGETHSSRISAMVTDVISTSEGIPRVCMSPRISQLTDRLKDFLFERVYWNPVIAGKEIEKSERVIRNLFRYFMEYPEEMQGDFFLGQAELPARARTVCDYLAGMTDRYALSTESKLRHTPFQR